MPIPATCKELPTDYCRRHLDATEFATLEWVASFNHRQLRQGLGDVPTELEQTDHRRSEEATIAV